TEDRSERWRAIARQSTSKKVSVRQGRPRRADKQVSIELRTETLALDKADACGRDGVLPTELGIAVMRPRQEEEPRQRFFGRVGQQRGRPAELLETEKRRAGLNCLEFGHATDRPHDLNPAAIQSGFHAAKFIEGV